MARRTTFGMTALGLLIAALAPTSAGAAAPAVTLSTTTLAFGAQPWLQRSAPLSITVTNTGDAALVIQSVDFAGSAFGPMDFAEAVSPQPCPPSYIGLAPGAQCQVAVLFSPQSGGPRSNTLSIYDNAPDSPQTVSLTGNGAGPVVRFFPDTVDFGYVPVGTTSAAQTLTAVNAGDGPLTISSAALSARPPNSSSIAITSNGCTAATLGPGQRCSISMTLTPSALGGALQVLTLTDNAGSGTQTYTSIGGSGAGAGAGLLSTPRFGQGQGTTSAVTPLQVINEGTSPVQISTVDFDTAAAGFAVVHDGCLGTTIPLNTPFNFPPPSCEVDVTFTPPSTGTFSANLVIHDNAFGGTDSIALSGDGYAPVGLVSNTTVDYGYVPVGGQAAIRTVTVANPSTQPLAVTSVTLNGQSSGAFAIVNDGCTGHTVAGGNSCGIDVAFAPPFTYLFTTTLTIRDNSPVYPPDVTLRGEGQSPTFTISSNLVDFGTRHMNVTSSALPITVTNTSAGPLTFNLFGTFPLGWSGCTNPVDGGASCTAFITVTPSALGSGSAVFKVVDPSGNQQVVEVRWTGTTGEPRIEGDSLAYINQRPGSTVTRTAVVINGGSDALKIGQVVLAPGSPASLTSDSCSNQTIPVAQHCTLSITVTPAVAGQWFTTLTVPSDASVGPNPLTVNVDGTAATPQALFYPSSLSFAAQGGTSETTAVVWVVADGLTPAAIQTTLHMTSVAIAGAYASSFRVAWDGCSGLSVLATWSCPIAVGFSPRQPGNLTAAATFTDDGDGSPQAVPVTGFGLVPVASVSPAGVDFGTVVLKSKSNPVTVAVTNTGTSALHMGKESLSGTAKGDYTISSENCQNQTLAPGATCQVTLVFRPSALGARSATLSFTDDAPGSPQAVQLTGTGVSK